MPKFLIVSATKFEIQPLLDHFKISLTHEEGLFSAEGNLDMSVLITGVGMVNTAFFLGKYSHIDTKYIVNLGVCGAINRDIKLGEVLNIIDDTLSEMGAEDDDQFIQFRNLNLGGTNAYSNNINFKNSDLEKLTKVSGITVNTVHGNETSILKLKQLWNADIESMEGAAFFRGCAGRVSDYIQLRAVSNYVEKRDKSKWNMPLAIKNLNDFAIKLIEHLDK